MLSCKKKKKQKCQPNSKISNPGFFLSNWVSTCREYVPLFIHSFIHSCPFSFLLIILFNILKLEFFSVIVSGREIEWHLSIWSGHAVLWKSWCAERFQCFRLVLQKIKTSNKQDHSYMFLSSFFLYPIAEVKEK